MIEDLNVMIDVSIVMTAWFGVRIGLEFGYEIFVFVYVFEDNIAVFKSNDLFFDKVCHHPSF